MTSGYDRIRTNLGSIQNKGWELDITSHNLTGTFKWSTSLNLSGNQNKVLDMGGIDSFTDSMWDGKFITRVGRTGITVLLLSHEWYLDSR